MSEREWPAYRTGATDSADGTPGPSEGWDAARVRALRHHVGETQRAFADRIGTNQQTISEWERGARRPRRMARRLLQLVAEQAAFYEAGPPPSPEPPIAPDDARDR